MGRFVPEAPRVSRVTLCAGFSRDKIEQMQEEVLHDLSKERLLSTAEEVLVDYLVDRYRLDLPSLKMDEAVRDVFEANVPVHHPLAVNARFGGTFVIGTVHNLEIPYIGHKSFFSRATKYVIQASFLLPMRKTAGSSLPSTAPL